MPLMSRRAYARHRAELGLPGSTLKSVQKAIAAGRITVAADDQLDSDVADREWAANSSEGHRRTPGRKAAEKAPPPVGRPPLAAPPPVAADRPRLEAPPALPPGLPEELAAAASEMSLAEASALEKFWKAKLAELDFGERSGDLVSAEEVKAKWIELVTLSKTKLLGIPSKCKARIPSLTAADVGVIDGLVREALEELAGDDEVERDGAAEGKVADGSAG
jgi:hypothetical protein